MGSDPKSKIDQLVEELNDHSYRYYVLSQPVVSDAEYDQKFRQLEKLEAENPKYRRPDSPTQRVGSGLLSGFKTIKHAVPMLSLNNAMDEGEIKDFIDQIGRFLVKEGVGEKSTAYTVEYKFDG